MFESNIIIDGIQRVYPLMVASDISAYHGTDILIHFYLRILKSFLEINLVTFCFKATEITFIKWYHVFQLPGLKFFNIFFRKRFTCNNQYIIKQIINMTIYPAPAGIGNCSCIGYRFTVFSGSICFNIFIIIATFPV